MNKKIKNILTGVLALVVFVALVVCAPVSRFIYGIYDNNRTNEILAQLEEAAKAAEQEAPVVSDYQKRAYFKQTYETLKEFDAARLFNTYIRIDSSIEWAQDNSQPVVAYKRYSRSAIEYTKLAKEIIGYAGR